MRTYPKAMIGDASQAEGLTPARARAVLKGLADADRNGLVHFADTEIGADEAAYRAAFPPLAGMADAEVRFVMRLIAVWAGAEVVG